MYNAACRDRLECRERLVRLDEEQRGIGQDLRAVEGMRKEIDAIERTSGKPPLLERDRLSENPRKRFLDLRIAFKTARARTTGRMREENERESDFEVGL